MEFRKDIDGLRGIAVLLVIIYHFNNRIICGGFIGVDIFFLISGYVMKMVYNKNIRKSSLIIIKFYSNRIKRIIPISYVVLFYVIIHINNLHQYNPNDIQTDVRYAIFGISNIRFYNKNIDYMYDSQPQSVILHFWSLSVEEQFYFIFPILLFCNDFVIYIFFFISLVYSIITCNKYYNLSYFIFKVRLWEFLFGIVIFISQIYMKHKMNNISFIGLIIIFIFSFTFKNNTIYPSFYPLIPFISLIPIFYNSNDNSISVNKLIKSFPLSFVGEISYSLYLWHYILLILYKYKKFIKYSFSITIYSLFSYYSIEYPLKHIKKYKPLIIIFSLLFGILLLKFSFRKYKYKIITKPPLFEANYYNNIKIECLRNEIRFKDEKYIKSRKWYLLIGDSHLLVWSPLLYKLSLLKEVCLLFIWVKLDNMIKTHYESIFSLVYKIKIYNIYSVFMSNYVNRYQMNNSNLQLRIVECLKVLKKISNNTYFIEDIPRLNINPHYNVKENINNYKFHLYSKDCIYFEYNLVKQYLKEKYLSFIDIICPNNICSLLHSNILMYVDNNHLSLEFTNLKKEFILKKYSILFLIKDIKRNRNDELFHLHYINNTYFNSSVIETRRC